jgi:hypothetical protein
VTTKHFILLLALSFSAPLFAQESIPTGTILPVRLNSSLSTKTKPGQPISARVMQNVPLGKHSKIPSGSTLLGHVVDVRPAASGSTAQITFVFDILKTRQQSIPVVTSLRALASMVEVGDAQIPVTGPDRGTPPEDYTTIQVGGEVVYRGGGPVMNGREVVGKPVPDGVLAQPRSTESGNCRGPIDGNDRPQALWIFSTDACGVYGVDGLEVVHSGRSDPRGHIVLASKTNDLKVRGGSGLLLRIISEKQSQPAAD